MKTWKLFEDECPICGNVSLVFTSAKLEGYAQDKDEARCADPICANKGIIDCDENGARIVWDKY